MKTAAPCSRHSKTQPEPLNYLLINSPIILTCINFGPMVSPSPTARWPANGYSQKQHVAGDMTTFAFSSDRPLRVLVSVPSAELKSHITDLVGRAYFNLHNAPISSTDPAWAAAIIATALHTCSDERVQHLSTRALVHLFEDIVRVSEEHLRESRRHASMASNAFYLREAVLDNLAGNEPHGAETTVVRIVSEATRLSNVTPDA